MVAVCVWININQLKRVFVVNPVKLLYNNSAPIVTQYVTVVQQIRHLALHVTIFRIEPCFLIRVNVQQDSTL